jgi:hypothetical protein
MGLRPRLPDLGHSFLVDRQAVLLYEASMRMQASCGALRAIVLCQTAALISGWTPLNAQPRPAILADGSELPSWEQPMKFSRTYYVDGSSAQADDGGPGSRERPFRTIGRAAEVLKPGERVVIAGGVYRESVHPARGGAGPARMISYEAAEGAKVVVKGSVVLKSGWKPSEGWAQQRRPAAATAPQPRIWQISLDGSLFGGYNPFGMLNVPEQSWSLIDRERLQASIGPTGPVQALPAMIPFPRRRGLVFIDGKPAEQVGTFGALAGRGGPSGLPELFRDFGGSQARFWVEDNGLTLHLRLPGDDSPDRHVIEITTKEQVFAPRERYLGYIRVKGITFEHAGNGFPVPQRGLVSTSRGHHWIIEGNTIEWANSIALDVGKEHWSAPTPEIPGYHIIRGNTIRYAGVCGIAGPQVENLLVENNLIEYTGWQDSERMYESAGIKFHLAKNVLIRANVIRHIKSGTGIWLDVGNVNCRLTGNVIADVTTFVGGVHIEGSHEMNLVDNNVITGIRRNASEPGGPNAEGWAVFADGTDNLVVAHNLFAQFENAAFRSNPVYSRIVEGRGGTSRNNRLLNNIFYAAGRAAVEFATEFNELEGNLYAAMPGGFLRVLAPDPPQYLDLASAREFHGWEKTGSMADMEFGFDPDTLELTLAVKGALPDMTAPRNISSDFFGGPVSGQRPPGPFEDLGRGYKARSIDPAKVQ